jgi:hypothetical protein
MIPATQEAVGRRIIVQTTQTKMWDSILKNNLKSKKARSGLKQQTIWLKALSSNPSPNKKESKSEKEKKGQTIKSILLFIH